MLQDSFCEAHGLQCGYCTPGMLIAAQALLDAVPLPTEEQIREAIGGNLCRCTGYQQIVEAVQLAAERLAQSGKQPPMNADRTRMNCGDAENAGRSEVKFDGTILMADPTCFHVRGQLS